MIGFAWQRGAVFAFPGDVKSSRIADTVRLTRGARSILSLPPYHGLVWLHVIANRIQTCDEAGLKDLLAAYEDEGSAHWLYTRALLAFREGRVSENEVVRLVKDARSANEHVPGILAGTASPVISDNDYITVGGPDEATEYVAECGPAWHGTPGAVEWLTKIVATLPANDA